MFLTIYNSAYNSARHSMKSTSMTELIRKITLLAILTAIVIVLQLVFAPMIGAATGLSPALVLIPIVIGVATCGLGGGAWLGAVFALIVMFDPTTVPFIQHNLLLTILLVFLKGVGSALIAGLVFKLFSKKNKYLAITLAAIVAPVFNTGIFVLGSLLFFVEITGVEIYMLFISLNFVVETVINAAFVPAIYHILSIVKKH